MNLVFLRLSVDIIRGVIARFPVVVLFAFLATGLAVHAVNGSAPAWTETLAVVCGVSFFVGLAGYLFALRLGRGSVVVRLLYVIFAEVYFWFLPRVFEMMRIIDVAQIFLLLMVSVIVVFSAPYFLHQQVNGFWQYNRQLMRRFLFTAISTGTLFVGIAISLASMQLLFDWQIQSEWYFRIWLLIVGLVSSIVFLAGIPKQFDHLEVMGEYPYVFEVFSKYVLVPLLILYGSILYVYGGKILLVGEWPKGTVSVLVFWYALLGIATCFLLFPRRDQSLWIRPMAKIFSVTLIPLAVLLLGAVVVRASEYGWTANRGGMAMFGVWLIGVALFNLTKKRDDIRLLFFVTAISIFVFSFGPLSVFSAARTSQIHQLELLLTKNRILIDGVVSQEHQDLVSKEEVYHIRSVVQYLWDIRGLDVAGMRLGIPLEGLNPEQAFALLGVGYAAEQEYSLAPDQMDADTKRYVFQIEYEDVLDIRGFSRLYQFTCHTTTCISGEGEESFVLENGILQVKDQGGKMIVAIDLAEKSQELLAQYAPAQQVSEDTTLPSYERKMAGLQDMTFEKNQGKLKIKLVFDELSFERMGEKNSVESVNGKLLVTRP